jgi:trans-2,3-dihydro-3-hydroxyanthranilate isomerase
MMHTLPYYLLDVFTQAPLEGNALAVFPSADGVDTATMQRIAREMNLSETAFVHAPVEGRPRVRIFTPSSEMEFAGHPTIGTAHLLRRLGVVDANTPRFELLLNVGLVPIRVDQGDDPLLWLTTPPIRIERTYDRAACARALSLDDSDLLAEVPCELLSAGNPTIYVALKDAATVDRAVLNSVAHEQLIEGKPLCLFLFAPTAEGAYSRMFAPELGVTEDPATGSSTGPLALFMMRHGLIAHGDGTRFTSIQGAKMGRRSVLHVFVHGASGRDGIEVGGHAVQVATGTLTL